MQEDVFGIVGSRQAGIFKVEEVVAEGGFAVVYRAHHTGFRANVALKCLKMPGALSPDEQHEFLQSFRAEAELLFHLSSALPQVVRPLQVGALDDVRGRFVPFIALEWLDGQSLDRWIRARSARGEPPVRLGPLLALLEPVALALAKAHRFPAPDGAGEVSIVHRDLKPDNIFIANLHGEERAKILDFGIAKVKSTATELVGQKSQEQSRIAAFTPVYAAPEQWLPKRFGQTGPWTDVWGFALTLVEALIGRAPLGGDQVAIMGAAIDTERRPTPNQEGASLPARVEAVFEKALAVDPKHRYHRIDEFWGELRRAECEPVRSEAPPEHATALSSATGAEPPAMDLEIPELEAPAPPIQKAKPAPTQSAGSRVAARRSAARESDHDDEFSSGLELGATSLAGGMGAMDGVGLSSVSQPVSRAYGSALPVHAAREPQVSRNLGRPISLLLTACAVMALDWGIARVTGEPFRVGPMRAVWIAGPLALYGLFSLVSQVFANAE
jgi:serine/threonine-protein kinase